MLFAGKRLNDAFGVLREFSIPEPVTCGLLFSVLIAVVYIASEVEFDLGPRDVLLVYFLTTIGINASLRDLLRGGKPPVILLSITIDYMFLQNLTGISLGSTPTAMANMSAVAKRYGASPLTFIIVPLVCAVLIDIVNALLIPFFLSHF